MKCKDCKFYLQSGNKEEAICTKSLNDIDDVGCLLKLNIVATTRLVEIIEGEANNDSIF